jgi:hypothetical protein
VCEGGTPLTRSKSAIFSWLDSSPTIQTPGGGDRFRKVGVYTMRSSAAASGLSSTSRTSNSIARRRELESRPEYRADLREEHVEIDRFGDDARLAGDDWYARFRRDHQRGRAAQQIAGSGLLQQPRSCSAWN